MIDLHKRLLILFLLYQLLGESIFSGFEHQDHSKSRNVKELITRLKPHYITET